LIDFWKNVPSSVLFEHRYLHSSIMIIDSRFLLLRLKCTLSNKPTSVIPIHQTIEPAPPVIRPTTTPDSSIADMQKIVNDIFRVYLIKSFS